MKITIFAFVAAWVVFITRQIASRADEKGNIYIPTPVQLYKAGRRYLSQLWKYVKKYWLKTK